MKKLLCPSCGVNLLERGIYSKMNVAFRFEDGKVLPLDYSKFQPDMFGSPLCCENCNEEIKDSNLKEELNSLLDEMPIP